VNGPDVATALELLLAALRAPPPPAAAPAALVEPEFMTVADFAQRLGVCDRTIRNMLKAGMPHVRPTPRVVRIRVAPAEKWLADETNRGRATRAMKLGAIEARRTNQRAA
jgi:excisionase family DNA binding protein